MFCQVIIKWITYPCWMNSWDDRDSRESDDASVYEMISTYWTGLEMILFTHQSTSSSLTQKSCTLPAPLPCTYASQQKIKSMQYFILSEHSYNANTQPCKDKIVNSTRRQIYRSRALLSCSSYLKSVLFLQRSQYISIYFHVVKKPQKARCGS